MQRWQEQWEKVQADFQRCIRTFGTMSQVWNQLANSSMRGGRAYAKKKSAMFKAMDVKARHLFSSMGYHHLLPSIGGDDGMILADILRQE